MLNDRVTFDKLDIFWPLKKPDFDLLDYSILVKQRKQSSTIEELKTVEQDYLDNVSKEELLRITANFDKKAALCEKLNGGHFEQLLKKKN